MLCLQHTQFNTLIFQSGNSIPFEKKKKTANCSAPPVLLTDSADICSGMQSWLLEQQQRGRDPCSVNVSYTSTNKVNAAAPDINTIQVVSQHLSVQQALQTPYRTCVDTGSCSLLELGNFSIKQKMIRCISDTLGQTSQSVQCRWDVVWVCCVMISCWGQIMQI